MTRPYTGVGIASPQYRLPEAAHPDHVRLQVADLERSLGFYRDVLGLTAHRLHDAGAVLGAGSRDLVKLVVRPGARPVPRSGRLGLFHVAFLLPERGDLARFVRHVRDTGARIGMSDHLVSEALYLSDPDGLGIEVYADRPRHEWRQVGRQIAMTTEPLDVEDLLAAAGDRSWNGAPAGTGVGHVHLRVGDLEQAADFYHRALGLDKVVWSYPGALFLSAGGYHHHLGVNIWAGKIPPASDDEARLMEWSLLLPDASDVLAAAESLEQAGYVTESDGSDRIAADPWGTRLRITSVQ